MYEMTHEQSQQLKIICCRYGVQRLDVFGSAVTGAFNEQTSDIDLVVTFAASGWEGAFNRFFGLKDELEALFGRSVDLIQESGIRTPHLRDSINQTRKPLYAA